MRVVHNLAIREGGRGRGLSGGWGACYPGGTLQSLMEEAKAEYAKTGRGKYEGLVQYVGPRRGE